MQEKLEIYTAKKGMIAIESPIKNKILQKLQEREPLLSYGLDDWSLPPLDHRGLSSWHEIEDEGEFLVLLLCRQRSYRTDFAQFRPTS